MSAELQKSHRHTLLRGQLEMKRLRQSTPTGGSIDEGDSLDLHSHFREEMVKLIAVYLSDSGFVSSAKALIHESKSIPQERNVLSHLRYSVVNGEMGNGDILADIEGITQLVSEDALNEIRYLMVEQGIIETCSSPSRQLALLRQLWSYSNDKDRIHVSSTKVFSPTDGSRSRECLWDKISCLLPPALSISGRRLEDLIAQAVAYQRSRCVCGSTEDISLFADHTCETPSVPDREGDLLLGHRDEVWFVSVSPCGKYVASCGRDKDVFVWSIDVRASRKITSLSGHTDSVSLCAWSFDGASLLTGSNDRTVRLWSPFSSSACMRTFSRHTDSVSGVAWVAGSRFVSSSPDQSVLLFDAVSGHHLASWFFAGRVNDIAFNRASNSLIVAAGNRGLEILDLTDIPKTSHNEPQQLLERSPILCLESSLRSAELLVALSRSPPTIHLWDLTQKRIKQKYTGHAQGRFAVRCAFGGHQEQFVVSGSENGNFFVWNKIYGTLISSVAAHAGGSVNCVRWVQREEPPLLVSCGDDRSVKLWCR